MAYWSGWLPYGYSHPSPFQYAYPTDPSEALNSIDRIELLAGHTKNPRKIFELYEYALDICSRHDFKQRAAKIHCKLAEFTFKTGDLNRAMQEADNSVDIYPDHLKGYYWRAITRQHFWYLNKHARRMYAARAVEDYVTYYRKTSRREKSMVLADLCTATTLAVDSGNTAILKLGDFLTREECTAMVTTFLSINVKHLQYVIMKTDMTGSGIAIDLKCDLSELKISKLFDKKDIDVPTIEAVMKLGAKIKLKDVEKAVKLLSDDQVSIFEFVLMACDPNLDTNTFTSLCNQALSLNKPEVSAFLISKGAKPDSESIIKSIDHQKPHESLVSYLLPKPDGCVCLLMHAINNSALALAKRCLEGCTLIFKEVIDLANFLKSPKDLLCWNPDFFEELLKLGVNPNGLSDGSRPIDAILALPSNFEHKSMLICTLAEHGADFTKATCPRTQGTSIFHIGTEMAIQLKDVQVLETICSCYRFPDDFDTKTHATNSRGQTPYHLIMQQKQSDLTIKICEILSKYPINPSLADERGQRPADFKLPKFKGDKRVPILIETAKKFQAEQSRRKAKSSKSTAKKSNSKSKKKGVPSADSNEVHAEDTEDPNLFEDRTTGGPASTGLSSKSSSQSEDPNLRELSESMDFLSKQSSEYFATSVSYTRQSSSHKCKANHPPPESKPNSIHEAKSPVQPLTEKMDEIDKEGEDFGINKDDILANFDDESLKWEVEFPENVVKHFKGMSNDKILCLAIRKIQCLATGIPTNIPKLCKRVRSDEEIYETRVTKAIRIIWEVATQFSPTLTSKLRNLELQSSVGRDYYLYSEVIRIWDIVEDHDNLDRSIDLAVKRIKSCHQRGEHATNKVPLLPSSRGDHVSIGHSGDARYPRVFTDRQLDSETRETVANQVFCYPAGSAKDDEYNVITFYPFDLTFVKSILEGEDARRDFPYKEWPKEHDIINTESRSILLLGRRGTGKTTCCLYRLWNYFKNYWSKANDAGPLLPARPLVFYHTNPDSDEESDSEDETVVSANYSTSESQINQSVSESKLDDSPVTPESNNESELESTADLEHLHQIFITKNYVLCAQMKKRFYDLAAGSDIAKDHMPFEDAEKPTSLTNVDKLAYPLFLTAREFFLLLDNSLGDEKEFFKRNPEGKLVEKIRSSDYDEDPDTLLDLDWESDEEQESGSESSDDEAANPNIDVKVKQPQRREVTASYFVKKIWPIIRHICEDKKTDPLLIWMEIKSFIKGSRKAVESEKGYLTQEEYEKLGVKMASNFAGNRQEVYKVFEKYQHFIKQTADERLFDDCEFIHKLFRRLCKLKEVPFSIHSFYVDEVQDFTQAELSILLRCCKDPNNLFLTGDTAQSIMRGVSFRFSDLRSLFHKANKQATKISKKAKVAVPTVDELSINFRSHSGVLKLAASVIDVLQKYFPNSFDFLPGDEGMFPGPDPKLLDSCNFSDLALVLRGNKRESSAIEFGAHQVIIVQSEDAKRALPSELQAGIALTVFEAKGLEFDDVLLYDFFKDSKVSKEWRIVTEFIESTPKLLSQDSDHIIFEDKPRRLKFDEKYHKSLSAELKYLYTAITRAKCNLWIYDSDEIKRLPMFDYWHRRGLVKILRLSEISEKDENALFAATSTKEEWKRQGDYFKKKKLWEPAMKCYVKAEETYFQMEAKAYCLVQQACAPNLKPREMEDLYLQAALAFFECDRSKHDLKSLRYAASFLKKAKRPNEAGLLYAKLNRQKDALKEFKKSKNYQGLVHLMEQDGKYNEAVSVLVEHGRREEALEYSLRYVNEGHELRNELRSSTLALRFAKQICDEVPTQRSCNQLARVTKYMDDPNHRIAYLKLAKKYREAFKILCTEKKYDDACRLCMAQGWFDEGLKLAEGKKHQRWTQEFVFQKAISDISCNGKADDEITKRLDSLTRGDIASIHIKAKSFLLLGRSKRELFFCQRALKFYTDTHNSPGCVEAFNLMVQFRKDDTKIDIKQVLHICNRASLMIEVVNEVLNQQPLGDAQRRTLTQIEEFYGLQKSVSNQNCYCLLTRASIWIQFYDQNSKLDTDSDGMIQIDSTKVMRTVSKHIQIFLKQWKENDELQICQQFHSELKSFRFHSQIQDGGYALESYKMKYHPSSIYNYLELCCLGLKISAFPGGGVDNDFVVHLLSNILTPSATLYLDITKGQMQWIATSAALPLLEQYAATKLKVFDMNNWIEAWRILGIIGKNRLDKFWSQLKQSEQHVNSLPKSKIPNMYILDISDKYVHVFSMWLRSCELIQKNKRVIASSKVILHYVLKPFIRHLDIRRTLSITNLVNILTIHTTALLSVTALCHHLQGKRSNVLIPESYLSTLNVFDNLGRLANTECTGVLDASMNDEKVLRAYYGSKNPYALLNLQREVTPLLWEILHSLLGMSRRFQKFRPLEHSMQTEVCIKRGEARHCLVLVLVLFGNLTEIDQQYTADELLNYQIFVNSALQRLSVCSHSECHSLQKAYNIFSSSANTTGFFSAIGHLINIADPQDRLVRISVKQRPDWIFDFNQAHTRDYPSRSLLSTTPQSQVVTESVQISPLQHAIDSTFQSTDTQALPQTKKIIDSQLPVTSDTALTPQASEQPLETVSDRINFEDDDDLKNVAETAHPAFERQSSEITASSEHVHIEKTESDVVSISKEYCMYCVTPLRPDDTEETIMDQEQTVEGKDTSPQMHEEELTIETYTAHLHSENHSANVEAYEHLIAMKSDQYEPKKNQLHGVLKDLKRFMDDNVESNLNMTIQEIEKVIASNDLSIDQSMAYAQWKECVSKIEHDMLEKMEFLIHNAPSILAREQERIAREQHEHCQAAQFQESIADDELSGGQSDEEIGEKLNASKVRVKERQAKKLRKERDKQAKSKKHGRKW